MGTVTCTIILKSIMSISAISLVFLNYSLGRGLHNLSLIKGQTASNLRRKMRTTICPYGLSSEKIVYSYWDKKLMVFNIEIFPKY